MSDMLAGKVVIVTGASSGIGRAIAIGAGRHGAKAVVVADLMEATPEGGSSTASEIKSLGGTARFVRTNVRKHAEVDNLVDAADEFGGVDVMVANAGSTLLTDDDGTEEAIRRLMSTTLDGTLHCAQAAARQMKARGKGGSIVVMAGTSGLVGAGTTVVYSTIRGGIVLMARHLASAVGPDGIRVNSVCPGTIETLLSRDYPRSVKADDELRQRTSVRRLANPSEIADAVAWLGSDMSSYVTGVALTVDGGLSPAI